MSQKLANHWISQIESKSIVDTMVMDLVVESLINHEKPYEAFKYFKAHFRGKVRTYIELGNNKIGYYMEQVGWTSLWAYFSKRVYQEKLTLEECIYCNKMISLERIMEYQPCPECGGEIWPSNLQAEENSK